jgi:hypothetical protein
LPTAGLFALILSTAETAAGTVPLAPHHAIYKLSLSKAVGEKSPAAASGVISYDFSGSACEGYAMVFRQITELEPAEGDSRVSDMRSATFEDGDAAQFRFDVRTTYNRAGEDDLDGRASKGKDGSVAVDLQKPTPDKVDLKASALFPTEHLRRVLGTAEAGGKILAASVYDGSDTGKKIYNTLSVIGAPITTPPSEQAAQIDPLKTMRRWPVSISYFEEGQGDAQPNYVLSFELYENGVSRALKLNYGSFTLAGEMVELKLNAASPCDK